MTHLAFLQMRHPGFKTSLSKINMFSNFFFLSQKHIFKELGSILIPKNTFLKRFPWDPFIFHKKLFSNVPWDSISFEKSLFQKPMELYKNALSWKTQGGFISKIVFLKPWMSWKIVFSKIIYQLNSKPVKKKKKLEHE